MQRASSPKILDQTWGIDLLLLSLILGFLFFFMLGSRPLFVPDEGRYAEIAREMIFNGDFITPHLNNIKYFEKPILFYWLSALAFKVGGINLWAIRSVNAMIALLGCLCTYWITRTLYDRVTALIAAFILSSSSLFFIMAHMVSLDLPVTVFISLCLYTFLLGVHTHTSLRRHYFWLAAIFSACAVLTKGLIGILFPCMIIFIWILTVQEWQLLRKNYLLSSSLIFLFITLPWHAIVQYKNPEFFYFYFIEQHFLRYTNSEIGHYQPFWFFFPCIILGFFPWIVFLPQALSKIFSSGCKSFKKNKNEIFFLLWAFLVFAFFTFSKSKLIPYILPVLPPLAILSAIYLREQLQVNGKRIGIKCGYILLFILSITIFLVFEKFTRTALLPNPTFARYSLMAAASILILSTCISFICSRKNFKLALQLTFLVNSIFLVMIMFTAPKIDSRSILPLAQHIKKIAHAQEEVVTFNRYYQDLPFYLARQVSILNWRNELSYGMQFQDTRNWMIDDATFWQRYHQSKRMFVVLDLDEYQKIIKDFPQEKFYFIFSTLNTVLISNQA